MQKILVEVSSPAAGKTYDMFVPDSMQIGEFASLAASLFTQLSDGTFSCSRMVTVSEKKSGRTYDYNKTDKESNIQNGTKIIIF